MADGGVWRHRLAQTDYFFLLGFYFTTLCRSYFALKISAPLFIFKFILKYRFASTHRETSVRKPVRVRCIAWRRPNCGVGRAGP